MRLPTDLEGTHWTGSAELWVDPLGDVVQTSGCTVSVAQSAVRYTWSHEGAEQSGTITLDADGGEGARFTDSWHQPEPMVCRFLPEARGLVQVLGAYGPDGDWGWRIALCRRTPTGELVLQMTNIAPWGEEARAMRMICHPAD